MEILLVLIGGRLYTWLEILWRGSTHWTMFLLGGACFVIIGLLNEHLFPWELSLAEQAVIGAGIITILEFFTGCVVNLWLKWDVWDYSGLPCNLMGQICLYYFLLWIVLTVICILMDDWIRYWNYLIFRKWSPWMRKRERPHYCIFGST